MVDIDYCPVHGLRISLSDLRWTGILIKSLVNPLISVLFFYPRRFRELKLIRTTWKFIHYPTIIFTIDFRRFFYPTRFFRISARGWGWRKNLKTQLKNMKLYRNSRSCAGNILFSCANALGSMMDFGIAQKYRLMANNRCSRSKIPLSAPNIHLSNWSPLLSLPRSSLTMTIRILSTKF